MEWNGIHDDLFFGKGRKERGSGDNHALRPRSAPGKAQTVAFLWALLSPMWKYASMPAGEHAGMFQA
jgi:hypothetical protein